ncbi:MAG: TonB-dependent receptor [Alphaproteobacteria bacterium]|nr:TonB-dependent receptor [Alphaproteobacteria bacterium]MDE2110488.1 TonB-dependent receptor [Alphaproteobacteria bacterium]MDE2493238.1 TonB-dependent receptor [Alphaproteobacteria bacterium]
MGNSSGGAVRAHPVLLTALLASSMLTTVSAAVADDSGGIETIIVTAQKRAEDLQKVPINVQVLTSQKLSQMHLTDFTDFAEYMPSVTFAVSGQGSNGGPGFANITMRGIASDQNGNHSGPLPTVGVYLDEQPITTIGGTLDVPTYDVQRVEALSGPQGTLYGASSESGTIRIITNKPDMDAFSANYGIETNSVDHGGIGYSGHGMVNIPLEDNIAVRIVAWDEHDAGYIDNIHGTRTYPTSGVTIDNAALAKNDYNTVDKMGGRAALEIDLDDNWTITPTIMGQVENSKGVFAYDPTVGMLQVKHFFPEYVHDKWYQAALTVQGKISNLDVIYTGGYMDRAVNSEADYTDYSFWYDTLYGYGAYITDNSGKVIDPSQYIVGVDHFIKENHEFRISTPKDDRLRVVAGAFYERQTHDILQDYKINGISDAITIPGWPDTLWLTNQVRVDRDYALFGELSYDILPSVTATAGIRLFEADNSLRGFFGLAEGYSSHTGVSQCPAPHPTVATAPFHSLPCLNLNARVRQTGETHKFNLTWHVDDDRMLYATYSTGFRPGGVNRRSEFAPYKSDTLTNYEVGWKTSWNDNRVRFNGAIYLENWKDFQFPFLGPNSLTIIANGGQAQVKGAEFDLTWLPVDNLTLTGAGAYNDAHLTADYCGTFAGGVVVTSCPGTAQAPKGTQLPITPKWKLNATARYEFMIGDLNAHVQGSLVHQSGTWPDLRIAERTLLGQSRAYTMFDFTTGVERDNWTLELYVKNLTDERAQLGRYAECTPGVCGYETYILTSQPRTIGLTFGQKF